MARPELCQRLDIEVSTCCPDLTPSERRDSGASVDEATWPSACHLNMHSRILDPPPRPSSPSRSKRQLEHNMENSKTVPGIRIR